MLKYFLSQFITTFKIFSLLIILNTIIVPKPADADVIMPNTHLVKRCAKVTNADQFSGSKIIGHITGPMIIGAERYTINSNQCLTIGYKFNQLNIYAVILSYFNDKGLDNIDLNSTGKVVPSNISIGAGNYYITDNDPLIEENIDYTIAGFTDDQIILYKSRHEKRFNDDSLNQIDTFSQPDIPGLRKTMKPLQVTPLITINPAPPTQMPTPTITNKPQTSPSPTTSPGTNLNNSYSNNNSNSSGPASTNNPTSSDQPSQNPAVAGTSTVTPQPSKITTIPTPSIIASALPLPVVTPPDIESTLDPEPFPDIPAPPERIVLPKKFTWNFLAGYIKKLFGFSCSL